ncbi:MAG: RnfH family protein [Thiomicrorhabdus sp.]|nr:RnfH family protein [Thiomicrorhabdus sp.]
MVKTMQIEVAYGLPDEQFLYTEQVSEGCTVIAALKASTLLIDFPGLNLDKVGVFGKLVTHDTVLRVGDRIEVYRPLKADPRDRRRKQVEQARKASK